MADSKKEGADRPLAHVVSTKSRSIEHPLEWPVEFDGKTWDSVTIRRVTGKEMSDYVEAVQDGKRIIPPMFGCPMEVYDAMDDDDRFALDEAAGPFIPRRLRAANEPSPATGGATAGS